MSEVTTTPSVETSAPATTVAAPKKSVKKAAPKKTAAAKTKTATPTKKASPAPTKKKTANTAPAEPKAKKSDGGVKWSEKRVAIVKAMRKLGATDATSAKSADDIAKKAGLDPQEVKHYCYHKQQLVVNGFVKVAKLEDVPGIVYHLTKKGADADLG